MACRPEPSQSPRRPPRNRVVRHIRARRRARSRGETTLPRRGYSVPEDLPWRRGVPRSKHHAEFAEPELWAVTSVAASTGSRSTKVPLTPPTFEETVRRAQSAAT